MHEQGQDNKKIEVFPVQTKEDLNAFIEFPWKIYAEDPAWVPPLLFERKLHLSKKNPFLSRSEHCFWIARQNGRMVGRISAQIDPLYFEQHKEKCGYFGMLEAVDSEVVFQSLFNTAEKWLRDRGQTEMKGPFNLSINDELGLLVEGFSTSPNFMMGHAPQYYESKVLACGLEPEKDLLAYRLDTDFSKPFPMRVAIARSQDKIRLRSINKKELARDMSILREIFNNAWCKNWGFVPFTEQEFQDLGKQLKFIVPSEYVQIAEVDNSPAAMFILLPNLNELINDLNGRLVPLGWLKLIYRMKSLPPQRARVPLMGVKEEYQNSLLGAAMVYRMIAEVQPECIARGVKEVELSWVLEDNDRLKKILSSLGAKVYKRYRIFRKKLV